MLNSWEERPQELAHLLNPAFLGAVLWRAVGGYETASSKGMSFELAPLVLPLVLHPLTRSQLPTIITTLPTWIQEHKDVLIDLPDRIRELVPYTRETLIFTVRREALKFDDDGRIRQGSFQLQGRTKYPKLSEEINECWKSAEFVGRWLAEAGPSETVYALLGIRP